MFLYDSYSKDQFARDLLLSMNLNPTANRMRFMRAWMQGEGTAAMHNPLATTWNYIAQGATFFNCLRRGNDGSCLIGVQNYPTYSMGLEATRRTLLQPSYYGRIREVLQADTNKIYDADPDLKKDFDTWGTTYNLFKKTFRDQGGQVIPGKPVSDYLKHVQRTELLAWGGIALGTYLLYRAFTDNE